MHHVNSGFANSQGVLVLAGEVAYIALYIFNLFQDNKLWLMCAYQSQSINVLNCKNTLVTWLILVTPTLKYS